MNTHDSASAYFQSTACGASAVGQVVALYDIIVRDLRRAIDAVTSNQIEKRVNASNHALMVIGELQGVLDFARGGETALRLNSFYTVTRVMVTQASNTSSRAQFQELIAMFARLRAAWSHVERTVAPAEPTERLRISSKTQSSFSRNTAGPPDNSDDSSSEGWRA
jgi:flagellar biosynthetic protein FliS